MAFAQEAPTDMTTTTSGFAARRFVTRFATVAAVVGGARAGVDDAVCRLRAAGRVGRLAAGAAPRGEEPSSGRLWKSPWSK
jgi:hypothetical protein